MSKNKFSDSISGKGYYIALILCAVAIGITGYLYYRNAEKTPQQLQEPTEAVDGTVPGGDVAVVAPPDRAVATEAPAATGAKPGKRQKPVAGEIIAGYSMDALCYNQTTRDWRVHDGMDIAAQAGTAVGAAADGTVYTVYEDETMGMTVVISHDGGYTTKYASLDENLTVKAGDTVTVGQTIGYVGCTALFESALGEHVHFSVTCDGTTVDPASFLE